MAQKKTHPPKAAAASQLSQIDHIVVVMLENRSFDHMLGFLYADSANTSPSGQPFEGLTGNERNPDGSGGSVKVFPIQATAAHPYFYPGADCGEGYANTNAQLFGTNKAPAPIVPATNQGFVTNFAFTLTWASKEKNQVLAGTTASQSIFTALGNKGVSWSVYGYNAAPLTRAAVADISSAAESHFGEFADFQKA